MSKRTITSCWKQYEKMSQDILTGEKDPDVLWKKINTLTEKANKDDIGSALQTIFVKPYISVPAQVQFTTVRDEDGSVPKWRADYDEVEGTLLVHPVAVVAFINEIRALEVVEGDYEDFLVGRYKSFLVEVGKLPTIYIMFLSLLQRIAYMLEIAHLEKRGGIVEVAEGEQYHTLLWAFKELETFSKKTYGISIRAHYRISWYESDWITGR